MSAEKTPAVMKHFGQNRNLKTTIRAEIKSGIGDEKLPRIRSVNCKMVFILIVPVISTGIMSIIVTNLEAEKVYFVVVCWPMCLTLINR